MNNSFINTISQALEDEESINIDTLHKIVLETSQYFASLENSLEYGNPSEQERAVSAALEVKEFLDAKANELASDRSELSAEDQEMIAQITNSLKLGKNNSIKINKLKPIKLR
jgi:hypothetical protein